ncbi:unnamed protein product [Mytilus coruscus]|uniref:Uncharacterized protein n=1 Tax=Mytilus coruscus TaxID=42192 RepID=A0A6J8CUB7_MYTCO|nr:unnamed protein product [Mytilus coruscus]
MNEPRVADIRPSTVIIKDFFKCYCSLSIFRWLLKFNIQSETNSEEKVRRPTRLPVIRSHINIQALPNKNKTIVSRNAKDFDTIEQIDEVSSHQGEGNVNNITGEQNLEKIEEQNEETTEEQNDETSFDTNANDEKMRSRKRKKQSELWKQNLRKRRRQSGMEYINTRGNTHKERS